MVKNAWHRIAAVGVAAALAIGLGPVRARAEQRYWITDVGAIGGESSTFRALNEAGQVIGWTGAGGYLFSNGTMTLLGGDVYDINDLGQVIGNSGFDFLYSNGTYTDLSALGGLAPSGWGAINNAGQVLGANGLWQSGVVQPLPAPGYALNDRGQVLGSAGWPEPFMYLVSTDGTFTDLSPLRATGNLMDVRHRYLNDNGMVVGAYSNALPDGTVENRLGYSWNGGTPIDIGLKLHPGGDDLAGDVRGMNANNDVWGNAWGPVFNHGFVFRYADQQLVDIGGLGGSTCLHGVNDRGDVVGHSSGPGDRPYFGMYGSYGPGAHIVYTGGKVYDLNAVIPPNTPYDLSEWQGLMNNNGQLLVNGWTVTGAQRTLLLTPLPVSTAAVTSGTRRADGWYTTNATVTVTGTDAVTGVREVRYRIDSGAEVVVKGSVARPVVNKNGTHVVSFYAVDKLGHAEDPKTIDVSVAKGGLVVTTSSLSPATAGVAYDATLTASGPTGTATWTAQTALPPGLALSSSGRLSGAPTAEGVFRFLVQVRVGNSTSQAYLTLDVTNELTPVGISTTAAQRWPISLFAKGGRPPYSWSVDPASDATIEGAAFTSAIAVGQGVTVTVTDARGVSVTKTLTLAEYDPVDAVLVSGETTVGVNQPVSLQLAASGGKPGSAYTWAWDPNVAQNGPPGLKLDRAAGVVSGAIATPGTYAVPVMAQDEEGNVSPGTVVTLTVQ